MSDLCPVAVAQDSVEDEYQAETASESHLLLLKQKKYCDVTFTFPNLPDRIEAHEIYLKARSPVFAKIFRMRKSGNVESNEIEISKSTPEIFQDFLEFMYADKLEADIARALELMQLSRKYEVHPLTKKCEELLKTEIPFVDSVKVFQLARRYRRGELMHRAGQIMVRTFGTLMKLDAITTAEEATIEYLLLHSEHLSVKEVELFEMLLKYINMAPAEFTRVVVPTGLLSAAKIILIFSYFCGDEITRTKMKNKFDIARRNRIDHTIFLPHLEKVVTPRLTSLDFKIHLENLNVQK